MSVQKPKVAALQMASGPNVSANLLAASRLLQEAADCGAKLAVLPESFGFLGEQEKDILSLGERAGQGPLQDFLGEMAAKLGIWIVGGTVPLLEEGRKDRVRAACLVFNEQGHQVARYDKIHLFDVNLPETGEHYEESATIEPGQQVGVVDSPFGRLGLAVCYDLRFPELFRALLDQGAEIVALPAAFTALTGQAHWEILVRARAIENLFYLIAAAQGGYHVNGRETYGHSMIVDPWGRVLDQVSRGTGLVCQVLDEEFRTAVRRNFPVIQHRRLKSD